MPQGVSDDRRLRAQSPSLILIRVPSAHPWQLLFAAGRTGQVMILKKSRHLLPSQTQAISLEDVGVDRGRGGEKEKPRMRKLGWSFFSKFSCVCPTFNFQDCSRRTLSCRPWLSLGGFQQLCSLSVSPVWRYDTCTVPVRYHREEGRKNPAREFRHCPVHRF
jgi:hypothetical protein